MTMTRHLGARNKRKISKMLNIFYSQWKCRWYRRYMISCSMKMFTWKTARKLKRKIKLNEYYMYDKRIEKRMEINPNKWLYVRDMRFYRCFFLLCCLFFLAVYCMHLKAFFVYIRCESHTDTTSNYTMCECFSRFAIKSLNWDENALYTYLYISQAFSIKVKPDAGHFSIDISALAAFHHFTVDISNFIS